MEEAAEEAGRKPQGLRDLQVGGQGPTSISLGEGRGEEEVFDGRGGRKVAVCARLRASSQAAQRLEERGATSRNKKQCQVSW